MEAYKYPDLAASLFLQLSYFASAFSYKHSR